MSLAVLAKLADNPHCIAIKGRNYTIWVQLGSCLLAAVASPVKVMRILILCKSAEMSNNKY